MDKNYCVLIDTENASKKIAEIFTEINKYVFSECSSLVNITIPNSVTEMINQMDGKVFAKNTLLHLFKLLILLKVKIQQIFL